MRIMVKKGSERTFATQGVKVGSGPGVLEVRKGGQPTFAVGRAKISSADFAAIRHARTIFRAT